MSRERSYCRIGATSVLEAVWPYLDALERRADAMSVAVSLQMDSEDPAGLIATQSQRKVS